MPGLDSNTQLLLHCDGADAATATSDFSPTGHTITFNGDAELDTAWQKWGTASVLFQGTGNLSVADSTAWDIVSSATTDYTIDFQLYMNSTAGDQAFISQHEDSSNYWRCWVRNTEGIKWNAIDGGGTVFSCNSTAKLSATTATHLAFIKVGSDFGIYKDGNQVAYASDSDTATFSGALYVGSLGTQGLYTLSNMDEIRIQKSNYFSAAPVVGLTDTITVPTEAYQPSPSPDTQTLTLTQQTPSILKVLTHTPSAQTLALTLNASSYTVTKTTAAFALTSTLNDPTHYIYNLPGSFAQTLTLNSVNIAIEDLPSASDLTLSLKAPIPLITYPVSDTVQADSFSIALTQPETDNRKVDITITPYFYNPIVTGGCPQCGTFLYHEGRAVRSEAVRRGRNFDKGPNEDDNYVRCARCGFICNTARDFKAKRGSRVGWGMRYDHVAKASSSSASTA